MPLERGREQHVDNTPVLAHELVFDVFAAAAAEERRQHLFACKPLRGRREEVRRLAPQHLAALVAQVREPGVAHVDHAAFGIDRMQQRRRGLVEPLLAAVTIGQREPRRALAVGVAVDRGQELRLVFDHAAQAHLTRRHPAELGLALRTVEQAGHGHAGQPGQRLALRRLQAAPVAVEHAQCAHLLATGQHQRHAGIEADVEAGAHEAAVVEAGVLPHVGDLEHPVAAPAALAQRGGTRQLLHAGQAHLRLHPLALRAEEGQHRHRRFAHAGRRLHEGVEHRVVARDVEHGQPLQRLQAAQLGFVLRGTRVDLVHCTRLTARGSALRSSAGSMVCSRLLGRCRASTSFSRMAQRACSSIVLMSDWSRRMR